MVTPIYYVMFTTCTIISSALLFQGWGQSGEAPSAEGSGCATETYGAPGLITVLSGFLTICSGVFLLHISRQDGLKDAQQHVSLTPRSSVRAPLTTTITTRKKKKKKEREREREREERQR